MKPLLSILIVFCTFNAFSQQEEFHIQGQIVDSNKAPISDVYVINLRDNSQNISRENGIFNIWILPSDSIMITHVTYLDKFISAFDLLKDPIVILEPDTISIYPVNVYTSKKSDYQRAMENIQNIKYDPRPRAVDGFSEADRMQQLMQTHNKVERAAASSLTYGFCPSAVIGVIVDKIKLRKKSNQYNSKKRRKKSRDKN